MRTIAVLNQKGGVGKTTTTTNTAAAIAEAGYKVAVIDLDPQAHLTIHLGLNPETTEAGAYKVLTQESKVSDEIFEVRKNLWLLAANINLVGAESELVSVVGREIILREAMEEVKDQFDYVFIDCAPSLGLLTLNALACAKEVLIPLQPHFLALQGFGKLLQTVDLVNKRINPSLKVMGVLLCMFDSRASLPNEVKADIEQFLSAARGSNCAWSQAQILPVYIRRNIKLAEAPSYGKTIFEYEENCNGTEDYRKVAEFFYNDGKSVEPAQEDEQQDVEEETKDQQSIALESEEKPEHQEDSKPEQQLESKETPEPEIQPEEVEQERPVGIRDFEYSRNNTAEPDSNGSDRAEDDINKVVGLEIKEVRTKEHFTENKKETPL